MPLALLVADLEYNVEKNNLPLNKIVERMIIGWQVVESEQTDRWPAAPNTAHVQAQELVRFPDPPD